jgi:RHS repeat-associated protein
LYWYDEAGHVLAETNSRGNAVDNYVYFGGVSIAKLHIEPGPTYYSYYVRDHLGTTRMITDQAGNVCYDADYFPWGGEQHVYVNACPQNYKFTGKERDPDMGVDYFGARFYQAGMARFYSPDWSASVEPVPYAKLDNPQSQNLYTYVVNNPLRFTDADGHGEEGSSSSDSVSGTGESGQGAPGGSAQNKQLPPSDANHTRTVTVREVSGQNGNSFNHITVQVDGGKEVGFGPVQQMTKKQIAENASVPGQVEPRAAGAATLDAVTIFVTKNEANNAQANIDERAANPGNYQWNGRSCVDFGELVVHSTGAPAPNDLKPSSLIQDIRDQQFRDNSTQAP